MKKDTSEFKKRFQRWKSGEKVYEAGKIIIAQNTVAQNKQSNKNDLFYADKGKSISKYDYGTDDKTYLPQYEYDIQVTPQEVSVEKHKRITNEQDWQKYWGNVGAGYVNQAKEQAVPYILNGLSLLGGNPITAFAGIGGSIIGEELGANFGTHGKTIGGLIGGISGGLLDGDQITQLYKFVKYAKTVYNTNIFPRIQGYRDYLKYFKHLNKQENAVNTLYRKIVENNNAYDNINVASDEYKHLLLEDRNFPQDAIIITTNKNKGNKHFGYMDRSNDSQNLDVLEFYPNSDFVAIPHLGTIKNEQIKPLSKKGILKFNNFLQYLPVGTYIGDGKYIPFAQKFKDKGIKAMFEKRQLLNPTNPEIQPYSLDSYNQLLLSDKRGYKLRYTGDYFIPNDYSIKNVLNSSIPVEQQLKSINESIVKLNKHAKLGIIKDGQIQLPHAWIIKTK